MINSPSGDFGANFNLPSNLANQKTTSTASRLISNLFTGTRVKLPDSIDDSLAWISNNNKAPEYDPRKESIFGDDLPWTVSNGRKL